MKFEVEVEVQVEQGGVNNSLSQLIFNFAVFILPTREYTIHYIQYIIVNSILYCYYSWFIYKKYQIGLLDLMTFCTTLFRRQRNIILLLLLNEYEMSIHSLEDQH